MPVNGGTSRIDHVLFREMTFSTVGGGRHAKENVRGQSGALQPIPPTRGYLYHIGRADSTI